LRSVFGRPSDDGGIPLGDIMQCSIRYVLITPTKNEELLIGRTIDSVVGQTLRPVEWVVVDDGSSDRTGAIVSAASALHPWIRIVERAPQAERCFASVVQAVEAGMRALTTKEYDFIGLLDSDVCFGRDYFQRVIEAFASQPKLGLAGGVVLDPGERRDRLPRNRADIPGASQFFRRSCFEALGGLIAVPDGGWDALTCAQARMHGYETRLLTDLVVEHLKPRNAFQGGVLRRNFQMGVRDYALCYSLAYETFKCVGRCFTHPCFIGSIAWWFGYCYAVIRRRQRIVPKELVAFMWREQKRRIVRQFCPVR
jgi:biofilm PGA synthesis N-glycosyltransferase PgaC